MRLLGAFLAGTFAVALAAEQGPPLTSATVLAAGEEAPFAGVLVTEETYRHMAQAALDVPLREAEIKAWEKGHALAITAMENALEALGQCEPRTSGLEKVLNTVLDMSLLVVPLYCISKTTTTLVVAE